MDWISIKESLPVNDGEYKVMFKNNQCCDKCTGYSFYIHNCWTRIIALTCCAHKEENLINEIQFWKEK